MTRIYLDHAATTPIRPQALAAMEEGFRIWANPSSPHAEGRAARAALEDARSRMKAALGWTGEVIFTSGASEALTIAMTGAKLPVVAVSAVEHDAVMRHAVDAQRLPVDAAGRVKFDGAALNGLVVVQHANNETGVIQPVDAVASSVAEAGGLLLCDCAQTAGKLPLPNADMIALSAHKFGGPVGVGALLVRNYALLHPGGGQERGYRGGTENLPAVMAMVAALEEGAGWLAQAGTLRQRLEAGVAAAGGEVVAASASRIATIGACRMVGVAAAVQLIRLDGAGFAVSAGSACSSGSMKPSHVLTAMAIPHASEVIRVSIGRETTVEHIDAFIAQWSALAKTVKAA